jgi:ring-1,2-phenylacetyl-CoA epoxidase subunit PaaD
MCGSQVRSHVDDAWEVLANVPDPEVPVLSVIDLGLVREVRSDADGLQVVLTPTYSGCPATEIIEASVRDALLAADLGPVTITTRRAPAWTTDWISDEGRRKLREYGIAPPSGNAAVSSPIRVMARHVDCPRCGSSRTERLSAFGSTACKALYRCIDCREPFEYFKAI